MILYNEELSPEQISQKARIDAAKAILNKKKQTLDRQLEKTAQQNTQKEERIKQNMNRIDDDIKDLSSQSQSTSAMIPTNEALDQTFSQGFFYGKAGQIINYLINKGPASRELIALANSLKKDKEFSSIISKIKDQLRMDQPNENLLTVLKSKISTRIQNYEKI